MRKVCLEVNMLRLGDRLARTWGRPLIREEIMAWLTGAGFTPSGDSWFCAPEQLELLSRDEIIHQVAMETDNGITFLEPMPPGHPSHRA